MRPYLPLLFGLVFLTGSAVLGGDRGVWTHRTDNLFRNHPTLGYSLIPSREARFTKGRGKRTIYSVVYRTDEHGYRITPVSSPEKRDRFALFLGCSNTFGEGVEESETLPYRFGVQAPGYRPYNFGIPGYGPSHLLLQLRHENLKGRVREGSGVAFYLYYHFHVDRVVVNNTIVKWSQGNYPYFRLGSGGEPQWAGLFHAARPLTTLFYRSVNVLSDALGRRLVFPRRIEAEDRALTCALIEASHRELGARFPGTFLVTVIAANAARKDPIVAQCLKPRGLPYLDLRGQVPHNKGPLTIRGDGHATGLMNEETASLLVQSLPPR